MKLKQMTFTEHAVEGTVPESITVTTPPRELAYILRMVGAQNGIQADAILNHGSAENRAIYACLNSVVAGQFEDLDEMIRVVAG